MEAKCSCCGRRRGLNELTFSVSTGEYRCYRDQVDCQRLTREANTGRCCYCKAEKPLAELEEVTRAVDVGGAYEWEHDSYYCADIDSCVRRQPLPPQQAHWRW